MLSSFEFNVLREEQEQFLRAWESGEDLTFIGYKHNDGRRRIEDVAEIIDQALQAMDGCDFRTGARIYHDTLRMVSMCTMWARVLEVGTGNSDLWTW